MDLYPLSSYFGHPYPIISIVVLLSNLGRATLSPPSCLTYSAAAQVLLWDLTCPLQVQVLMKFYWHTCYLSRYVRIDNSSSLELQAWEQESNPNPGPPRAARPVDRRTARPCFYGIELPQADIKNFDPCSKTCQIKEIIAPNGRLITALNGGTDLATISFMNLKAILATNQEPTQERGIGPQPGPMTTTLKQYNQVAKSRFLTNERTPWARSILLLLDLSTQFPQPCPSQCPDEPPMENVKFGGPRAPNLLPFLNKVYVILAHAAIALFCICCLSIQFEISWPTCTMPAVFHPPGVPFRPVHFTNYPLKSEYKEYTPEKTLEFNPLACTQSEIRYNRQGLWIFSIPKLFEGN
ncbi:hypothetical protein DSO57_1012108 [Entomophthora muscae]|uniref:Uncharacterized protein n=1 Tax=Entomophthora muscae TaxID=34485 RepID=A0ACC2SIW8_9FUNG|nr:hypothetical protein DSO57_1012108 [Entomophthora muscae]